MRLSAIGLNRIITIEMSQIIIIIREGLLSEQLGGGVLFEWSYFWRGLYLEFYDILSVKKNLDKA